MDSPERIVENGRIFELELRQGDGEGGRRLWCGYVTVIGDERKRGGTWTVGPFLSDVQTREEAKKSMRGYRS